ncbi:MAG: beta-galactosidase [Lachnospira sp.]
MKRILLCKNEKNLTLHNGEIKVGIPTENVEIHLERMLKKGIEVIRIAEFAWNKVEPAKGEYTFDFFDEFLNLAYEKGMSVIFCTYLLLRLQNLW